ncbi:hypothetical protein V7T14_12710 [Segatella copri]|nr:hypothetical protein [Segatella copri]MBW0032235.1 hypothetical protein [Segatella copri]
MANNKIREEEVKNRIRQEFFQDYDATPILGDIDFAVTTKKSSEGELFDQEYFLWAEAKAGNAEDIYASFVQLIITIGKAHTHESYLPPRYLGAFDEEKIAFIEYHHIVSVFYQNDFNWNVTPSNHSTKEFHMLYDLLHEQLKKEISLFDLRKDEKELRKFIRSNFKLGKQRTNGINITKNNFIFVFQRWVEEVKPSIAVNWDDVPKTSIVDFFYADLISRNDYTLREELAVVLRGDKYRILQKILKGATQLFSEATFNDGKTAYNQFWNKYVRPPRKEYLDLILKRRDLLIPQDLRRYQGAFFTPPQWVQKSQEYLAMELGEDWQKEYYVWDCCAGTGNLLFGLTEKYRVYASTLDNADVQVMHERIKEKSLDLLDSHVFQFDFLNDSFDRLPQSLQEIINDPEKRRKLVVYINPPYAEAADKSTVVGRGKNKTNVAVTNKTYNKYINRIGIAGREVFAQFFMRIYDEISTSVLAQFSTLKIEQAPNFRDFRQAFRAKLGRNFIVPANSFDNVKGQFPIGFFIWHLDEEAIFTQTTTDVFDAKGKSLGNKTLIAYDSFLSINEWIISTRNRDGEQNIGFMSAKGNDFQNTNYIFIINDKKQLPHPRGTWITTKNITEISIYLAVRHAVEATWINDRDQFLYPNDGWKSDIRFQNDSLIFTLFSNSNNIQSQHGTNHWIPFCEEEVGAQDNFESHFMHDFIMGKVKEEKPQQKETMQDLFAEQDSQTTDDSSFTPTEPLEFSQEAHAVLDAGRELWRYYHKQAGANPNASYYDIKMHFQGTKTTKSGKVQMNSTSKDATYNTLIANLRQAMKGLAAHIEPKIYEYGFLKK